MSTIHEFPEGKKLTTTFSFAKLQEVPAWRANAVERAPHSAGGQSAASSSCGSDRRIDRAEPCFITQVSAYTNRLTHWVNAVRGDEVRHRLAKIEVENFLHTQGILFSQFDLDHPSNLANLDTSLHIAMDKYAMFAITCSHEYLDKYIDLLTAENQAWVSSLSSGGENYIRKLRPLDPSFRMATYELVVLQPDHFLPNNSLLPLYPREAGEELKYYQIAADKVLRELPDADSDNPEPTRDDSNTIPTKFPSILSPTTYRDIRHAVNPYLVILAAEIKFRRYLAAHGPELPEVYNSLVQKTIQVADLLYFQPPSTKPGMVNVDTKRRHAPVAESSNAELGFRTGAYDSGGDSTLRPVKRTKVSGTGRADADYWRDMLSRRDLELNDDDLELLDEIQESNRAASTHGQSLERVESWKENVRLS